MKVYLEADNIITSLGFSTEENFDAMVRGISGIKRTFLSGLPDADFFASTIDNIVLDKEFSAFKEGQYSKFEKLIILSAYKALSRSQINPSDSRTIFILSTTKGNVGLLEAKGFNSNNERLNLWHSANLLSKHFKNPNIPLVVSNACISGLLAMIIAKRLIKAGHYDHAVITGADVLSAFIVSGFMSFLSLSPQPCRPFDKERNGLSLGEGAGTIILSNKYTGTMAVELAEGISANDANHISGPSRTAEGLYLAIQETINRTGVAPEFISAHGTATPYNDDMESVAITRAGLEKVPVNSLKGYIGHTLGAAGIIESIISKECLNRNLILGTCGLKELGVINPVNVVKENQELQVKSFLKATSGFGGCNAVALFRKNEQGDN